MNMVKGGSIGQKKAAVRQRKLQIALVRAGQVKMYSTRSTIDLKAKQTPEGGLGHLKLVEELFKLWDINENGKISLQDLVKGLLSLGICRHPDFALRLVQMTRKDQQLLTLKTPLAINFDDLYSMMSTNLAMDRAVKAMHEELINESMPAEVSPIN